MATQRSDWERIFGAPAYRQWLETMPVLQLLQRSRRRGAGSRRRSGPGHRAAIEHLEQRTLLASAPFPIPGSYPGLAAFPTISQTAAGDNGIYDNTPSVTYDPVNPAKMVAVYTRNDTNVGGVSVHYAYSIDSGATWTDAAAPGNLNSPSDGRPYAWAANAAVAFDRLDNFYVTYLERDANNAAGAVVLQKYAFSTNTPALSTVTDKVLYAWAGGANQAYSPAIAVDANPTTFVDPDTKLAQTDALVDAKTMQGPVYVAWSTDTDILLTASADGGTNFSTDVPVGQTNGVASPSMVVSQGRADGKVMPGQLNIAWDAYNTSRILFSRVQDGGKGSSFTGTGGPVADADPPANQGDPDLPVTTPFTAAVNITDTKFVVSDMDVTLALVHPNLDQISVQLIAPDGTTIDLVRNALDPAGNPTNAGIAGANLGVLNGVDVGTVFDSDAAQSIRLGTAPFIAHFRPEVGDLTPFNGKKGNSNGISGTWTLSITDNRHEGNPPAQQVDAWSLTFTSGLTRSAEQTVVNDAIAGAVAAPYPRIIPATGALGVSPGPAIASDNTLGSFSPYQGRLYTAYVFGAGTDTDIRLATSDDGGATWMERGTKVNDDDPLVDGFSQGNRSQFSPSIAVDQSTGAVAISYYDTRWDGANARVATYLAASIDGGTNFNQTFVNQPNRATDTATRDVVDLGPIPDNQSVDYAGRDTTFGFGAHQGLTAVNGKAFPVWSGNFNRQTADGGNHLVIMTNPTSIPGGPRIISSTMGPVSLAGDTINPPTADGRPQVTGFQVQFDRSINPDTFTASSVKVIYRAAGVSGDDAGTVLPVKKPVALDPGPFGATTFMVSLDVNTPQTAVGTYSYYITPDASDRIRSPFGPGTGNKADQNSDGLPGQAASGSTTGDVYAVPSPTSATAFRTTHFAPPYNPETLPMIVPGPHVISTNVPGNPATTDNLVLNKSANSIDIVFDRDMDPSSFKPESVLRIMGPSGLVTDGHRYASPDVAVPIPDGGTGQVLTSRLYVPDDFAIGHLSVQLDITHPTDRDLSAVLIAPDNKTTIMLFNALVPPANAPEANFDGTIFDDNAPDPIASGAPPYASVNGFKPQSPLSVVNNTAVHGFWTLVLTDSTATSTGILNGWSITASPVKESIVVNSNPLGTDPDPAHPRTYRVIFPTQQLSGTYTLQLSSAIQDEDKNPLDENLNAGVYALFDMSAPTSLDPDTTPLLSVVCNSSDAPKTIAQGIAGVPVSSTISIPDTEGFVIKSVALELDLEYPRDTDLTAQLRPPDSIRLADGSPTPPIRLFTKVGGGTQANFSKTTFDDDAATLIQNGLPPYFGKFQPQQPLSNHLIDKPAAGTWTLEIFDDSATRTGTLNGWSLILGRAAPTTGMGEAIADQASISFRIFNQNPADPVSSNSWTAVGPASSESTGGGEGDMDVTGSISARIGALAVDPADASGNTVYVAGASGGIWKTTNFMSTDGGPVYVPLTDFGLTTSLNMGGLAVFSRGNDTTKSIVFGATGEGDTGTPGVGIVRSMDGGATWTLLDSSTNVDGSGNPLPIDSYLRDRIFVGTTSFKIVVDPKPTPTGDAIVYVALSSTGSSQRNSNGIWRSLDSGNHWKRMREGDATDVVLDPNSEYFDTYSNPTGNLQYIYGAFRGEGVYFSPNRGSTWNDMPGNIGDPLIQRYPTNPPRPIPVGQGASPNGAKGRISLAKPFKTGRRAEDLIHQGWLYAMVSTSDGGTDGLYMTKDFGQNWVKVRLPFVAGTDGVLPSNDAARNARDYASGGDVNFRMGNYCMSLGIDPTNPNVVYLGGTLDEEPYNYNLIRVDTTGISDAHSFFTANDRGATGSLVSATTDPVTPGAVAVALPPPPDPMSQPYLNLIHDTLNPFDSSATIAVTGIAQFANTGTGAKWTPFRLGTTDEHRIVTFVDPLTGLGRLITGDDHGVFTAVDDNGVILPGVGTAKSATGSRNGNLQIAQFYYGASQPTFEAAIKARTAALFYGQAQDIGSQHSDPDVLTNGNIGWSGPLGDGTGVATDQTATDKPVVFLYNWPCCGGDGTNFFQVDGIGKTFGLLQDSQQGLVPDPQWPYLGGSNFAVNPINGDQIVMSSQAGRVFATTTQGQIWTMIGNVADLDGNYAPALAYGAPDPEGPGGEDATNFFIYVGTSGGNMFVTFNGGGAVPNSGGPTSNDWQDLTNGLDRQPVQAIVTNPQRGSHEAYAVTTRGVFHMVDSAAPAPTWANITGNLLDIHQLAYRNPSLGQEQAQNLSSIQADWRYMIPDDPNDPTSLTHPVLYVGGDSGVYRSTDNGKTWTPFPDVNIDLAPAEGGYLPSVRVTDLDLALGNVDPTTGRTTVANGPDVLLATTYGRGSFAIRVAPLIVGGPGLDPSTDTGILNTDRLTNAAQPIITGRSEQSAFGNKVLVTLYDMANPDNPVYIGGYDGTPASANVAANRTDASGAFAVSVKAGAFKTDGVKTVGVRATDDAGVVGPIATTMVTIDRTAPQATAVPIRVDENSTFDGVVAHVTDAGALGTATIDWGDGTAPSAGIIAASPAGGYDIRGSHPFGEEGNMTAHVTVEDAAGNRTIVDVPVTVVDRPVKGKGGFTFTATEGVLAPKQTVATFTDPAGPEALSDYSADIDWGDGIFSPSVITYDATTKTFSVRYVHQYDLYGTYDIKVTLHHDSADSVIVYSTAKVADQCVSPAAAPAINAREGQATGPQTVATFTDPSGPAAVDQYSADIRWGDNTVSPGTITFDAGTGVFSVVGDHTYTEEGSYSVTAVVRHAGATAVNSPVGMINVSDVSVLASGVSPFTAFRGVSFGGRPVATFSDPGGAEALGDYSAAIDWGDGTPASAGTIGLDSGSGVFIVSGGHVYSDARTYYVSTIVHHDAAQDAIVAAPTEVKVVAPPTLANYKINSGAALRSRVSSVSFTLGSTEPLDAMTLGNLALLRNGNNAVPLGGATFTFDPATGAGNLDLRRAALADGDYQLQIFVPGGSTFRINFFKIAGDASGDPSITTKDLSVVQKSYGKRAGQKGFNANADLNGDGRVNNADVTLVKRNMNRRLILGSRPMALRTIRPAVPMALDFRKVKLNTTVAMDLAIRNGDSVPLHLQSLRLVGDAAFKYTILNQDWARLNADNLLQPGKTLSIRVYLNAKVAKAVAGQLFFNFYGSSPLGAQRVIVSLKGTVTR